MRDIVDNSELNRVMEILEEMEDQNLAVKLLKEFNDKTRILGQIIMNKDDELGDEEWERQGREAKLAVDDLIKEIEKQVD
jgi:hypothetical protein